MAEKFYHIDLKKEIETIAKISKRYKKIGIEKKIPIPHPNLELVFHYKPEIVLETKNGKKYIFEVLDDQLNDYNLIISDIIQSYLSENVSKVFFISKNEKGSELTRKLSKVIGGRLEDNGFFRSTIPEVLVYTISYKEARKRWMLSKILKKYSKKDGWD